MYQKIQEKLLSFLGLQHTETKRRKGRKKNPLDKEDKIAVFTMFVLLSLFEILASHLTKKEKN